ncbi:MAG: sensor histidine kinase [Myxococcales bacterium]
MAAPPTELLEVAAHDLRAPLTNIRSYADVALSARGGPLPPAVRRALEVIRRNADRALLLVQDGFDAWRGEKGLELAPSSLSVGDLLSEAAMQPVAERLAERGIQLRLEVESGLPDVRADHRRLAHVLQLLLERSAARAPEGSAIVVFARAEPPWLAFGIAHRGEGPEEDEAFDPSASVIHERRLESGLALPLARVIARAHGGDAELRRDSGGCACVLHLPL